MPAEQTGLKSDYPDRVINDKSYIENEADRKGRATYAMESISRGSYAERRAYHRALKSQQRQYTRYRVDNIFGVPASRRMRYSDKNNGQSEKSHCKTETDYFRRSFRVFFLPNGSLFHKSLFCRHTDILLPFIFCVNSIFLRQRLRRYKSAFFRANMRVFRFPTLQII